jgi:DNA-binding NarL/FixJ family response regulator
MVSVALFAADEDGVLVRLALREAGLAASGAYVMEVQSGTLDLQAFVRESRPDVVIYDVVPSAVRGGRQLDELQRVCQRFGVPCVLSVADVRDLQRLPLHWAACILVRPYDAEMARAAIREAMQAGPDERADLDDDSGGEAAA